MSEEFQERARNSGAAAAKLWYWREAFRNAWVLTAREILRTPARTALAAAACFLAVNGVMGLYFLARYYPRPIVVVMSQPMELVLNDGGVMLLLQFMGSFAAGWTGARLLPGREWALALLFTFVVACVTLAAFWYLRLALPAPLMQFMFAGIGLRVSGFWLGSLWMRRSTRPRKAGAFRSSDGR